MSCRRAPRSLRRGPRRWGAGLVPAYDIPLTRELVWVVGAPVREDLDAPRITLRFGYAFPLGQAIVWFFSEVLPNALASAGHAIRGVFEKLGDFGASLFGFGPDADAGTGPGAAPAPGQVVPLPPARVTAVASAVRAAAAASPAVADSEASSARGADAFVSPAPWSTSPPPAAPITVNVQVDGETIARASASATRDLAGRSLSPIASY
jgi:hypothetical protein